jgi:hypothetical protein
LKLNRYLTGAGDGLEIAAETREPIAVNDRLEPGLQEPRKSMKSRAELLAELEEKRLENNEIQTNLDELSIVDPDALDGYDPYDNPSLCKTLADGADIVARRRRVLQRKGLL